MKVILIENIPKLGEVGDILEVSDGYCRNYLIPKGFAVESTPQNIKTLEMQRKKIENIKLKATEAAQALKKQIEATEITFSHKAGEEGKRNKSGSFV